MIQQPFVLNRLCKRERRKSLVVFGGADGKARRFG